MLNLALAVFLLLFAAPVVTNFGGKRGYVQVGLVALLVPFVLLAMACLAAALRPGSLGRGLRRLRRRG